MPKSLADLLAETESVLDVRETQKQLRSGRLQQEDVEEMAPHTPWRDFLTETLLDPSQYVTGGVMGAGFAAKLGRPALATALEWADPLMGGTKAIGRAFEKAPGKWPIGARMGGTVGKGGGRGREVLPEELIGTPGREPAGLLETGPLEMGPSSLPTPGPLEVRPPTPIEGRTLGEMFPLGMRRPPTGVLPRATFEMPPSSLAPGELSEDVVNLSNSFSRQFRQPIDELVEAADKVISRNKLVQEAEKILGKKTERFAESPSEAKTHTARMLEQTRLNEEFLKKPIQGSPTETKFKVGDSIEFTDKKGKVIKGKIRDIDELGGTAEVFTDRAKVENPDRASEEVFLERIRE